MVCRSVSIIIPIKVALSKCNARNGCEVNNEMSPDTETLLHILDKLNKLYTTGIISTSGFLFAVSNLGMNLA